MHGPILDIGCGQGELVRAMLDEGYAEAFGIDLSPEQVSIAQHLGLPVERANAIAFLAKYSDYLSAVTATDFLEHLTREEISELLDVVLTALIPQGLLIARVPNAVSPFGGNYRYGDITHELGFTAQSLRQLILTAGFSKVDFSLAAQ